MFHAFFIGGLPAISKYPWDMGKNHNKPAPFREKCLNKVLEKSSVSPGFKNQRQAKVY